jgi:hypothetical protein
MFIRCRDSGILMPLVTGAGRSGTHAMAAMLNRAGLKAVHEGGSRTAMADPQTVLVSWAGTGYVRSSDYWKKNRSKLCCTRSGERHELHERASPRHCISR